MSTRSLLAKPLSAALFLAIALSGCSDKPRVIEQQIVEFGTIIRITLVSTEVETAEKQLKSIEHRLLQHRHFWHAWEESDLSKFNRKLQEGTQQTIPQSLRELITLSKQFYRKTDGLFNPALGKLIAAYGFHGSSSPQPSTIDIIKLDLPGMSDLDIKNGKAQSQNPHFALDLGGIAKGYSIAETAEWLKKQDVKNFLINAGGDLVSAGNRAGKPWSLGLKNPFAPGVIAGLTIDDDMALFTSGNYQRFYQQGGKIIHHIIDPRTGLPSSQIASATVLHQDPVIADVAATTLMIDGLENHREIAKSLGIKHYLVISEDKKIIVTSRLNDKLEWFSDWTRDVIDEQ